MVGGLLQQAYCREHLPSETSSERHKIVARLFDSIERYTFRDLYQKIV